MNEVTHLAPMDTRSDISDAASGRAGVNRSDDLLRSDRRHVVRLLAAGMVGAFTGAAALSGRAAVAADGEAVLQGTTNNATQATLLTATADTALVVRSDNGYGIDADGRFGNARFVAAGDTIVGAPAWAGTLYVDGTGNWWAATTSSDIDGQWRKLAGPSTAGALHMLPTPIRVYDSRPGLPPVTVGPKIPLAPDTARSVDVRLNASGVDPLARAALITLTVTGTAAPGYVSVWPSGPWPGTSTINFSASGQTVATTTVVALAGASFIAQSNTTTDVVIDVIGFYQ